MRTDNGSRLLNEFVRMFLPRYASTRLPPKQVELSPSAQVLGWKNAKSAVSPQISSNWQLYQWDKTMYCVFLVFREHLRHRTLGEKLMKCALRVVATFVSVVLLAQTSVTKYVSLAPKSNIEMATVSEGFAKYCPNVVVTENASKADYVLEAWKSQGLWHFALLSKDGDLLMATQFTHGLTDHFKSTCKKINAKARQHTF